MSKEDAAYQAWVEENRKAVAGDAKKLEALEAILADESFSRNVFRGGLRQDEFNRRLTAFDQEKKAEIERAVKARDAAWAEFEQKARAANKQLQDELDAVKRKGGNGRRRRAATEEDPDDSGNPTGGDPNDSVDVDNRLAELDAKFRKEFETRDQRLNAIDRGSVYFSTELIRVVQDAVKEGIELDVDNLRKVMASENLGPSDAYRKITQPVRDERRAAQIEKEKKEAYEKGLREGRSKVTPDDLRGASGPVPVQREHKTLSKDERRAAAAKTLRSAMDKEEAE